MFFIRKYEKKGTIEPTQDDRFFVGFVGVMGVFVCIHVYDSHKNPFYVTSFYSTSKGTSTKIG